MYVHIYTTSVTTTDVKVGEIFRKQTTISSNVSRCRYLCGAVRLFSAPSAAHSVWQTVKSTIENMKDYDTYACNKGNASNSMFVIITN